MTPSRCWLVTGANGFVRALLPTGIHHRERLDTHVMSGYLDPYPTWGSRRAHLASVRQIPLSPRHPTWRLLQEIGAELGISPRTVEIYRAKVMERMEAATLADLVRIAVRLADEN